MLSKSLKCNLLIRIRYYCNFSPSAPLQTAKVENLPPYILLSEALAQNETTAFSLASTITIHSDFVTESEERSILDEVEPYMNRLKYEFNHWDDAIHGYRETERLKWTEENEKILDRVRKIAFPPEVEQLKQVHVLDLSKEGLIKPHVDAVRFCGDTIAGLSLLTDSVMRLVHEKNKEFWGDVLLKRRSLYVMKGAARYEYTHEILGNDRSVFGGKKVFKDRRISVICRNEPRASDREK